MLLDFIVLYYKIFYYVFLFYIVFLLYYILFYYFMVYFLYCITIHYIIFFCIIFYIYCIILFILLYYILLQYIYLYTPTCLQSRFHHEIAVDNVYCPCFPSLAKRHSPSSALVVIVPPLDDLVTLCCNKSLGPIASDTKSSILPWMIH